jgi:hypothetical protein
MGAVQNQTVLSLGGGLKWSKIDFHHSMKEEVALITTEDSDNEEEVESEMRMFLKKVVIAKKLKAMNIESWIDTVELKPAIQQPPTGPYSDRQLD